MDYNVTMSELAKYTRIAEETAIIIEGLKNTLKGYMESEGLELLLGTEHKATYKQVDRQTLDSKALKADYPDIASAYTVNRPYMRFDFA